MNEPIPDPKMTEVIENHFQMPSAKLTAVPNDKGGTDYVLTVDPTKLAGSVSGI